jgi:hypothetical protein
MKKEYAKDKDDLKEATGDGVEEKKRRNETK